jgi:FtsH-binding integral membrane protein
MKSSDGYNQRYRIYLDERKSLNDAIKETQRQFDKAILTLAAGALALSLTFITNVVTFPKAETLCLLSSSWIAFVISIISTLISFFSSQKACTKQIEIMENEFLEERQETNDKKRQKNPYNLYTTLLNITSITFFILGVILLMCFTSINLKVKKEEAMSVKETVIKPSKPDGGYVPPSKPIKPKPIKKSE